MRKRLKLRPDLSINAMKHKIHEFLKEKHGSLISKEFTKKTICINSVNDLITITKRFDPNVELLTLELLNMEINK